MKEKTLILLILIVAFVNLFLILRKKRENFTDCPPGTEPCVYGCCENVEPEPEPCPYPATGSIPNCSCPPGFTYNPTLKFCEIN